MEELLRVRVRIRGKVQGVFYRAETSRTAKYFNLCGYVRNMKDGSVEAVFEGEKENVMAAVDWCQKGPPLAIVEKVDLDWEPPEETKEFKIVL